MSSNATNPPVLPERRKAILSAKARSAGQRATCGPKRRYDRYYRVLRVHAGDAILTDNWHTNEVLATRARTSRGTRSPCVRWKPGAHDRK